MQVKATMRYHYKPISGQKPEHCQQQMLVRMKQQELSCNADENVTSETATLEDHFSLS